MNKKILFAIVFIISACFSCAGTHKRDIESDLIAAMSEKCKTVEIKVDGELYIIDPTGRYFDNGCSIARMRGWKDGVLIMEKEVEVCACRKRAD